MDPTVYVAGWPAFEAYIDNQLVYKAGVVHSDPRNKFTFHSWHLIPLPLNFAGKTIYFRLYSDQPASFTHGFISVAARSDHLIAMVRRDLVHHQTKGKIDIIKSYGRHLPQVECYPNQLNQVFMNLLVNGAQAIEDAGSTTIVTGVDGHDVVVTVQDTGRGIAPEHLERVFEPGFTTKGVGVGMGLGLSISYKIIEDHDGRIEVDSIVGQGTTFRARIPIRHENGET